LGVGQAVAAGVTAAVPAPARRRLRRLWPGRAPLPVKLFLALGLMEFGHYWHHRASHEWGPMWRFHAVHHSAPRLYWANATWFHPVDLGLLSAMEQIPLHLLGVDAETRMAAAAFSSLYGQYQHTTADVDGEPANLVFSTPDQHRWHHSTVVAEGNTNYGARLSVWDRLFGTYVLPERPFDGEVGVHGRPDYPLGFGAQMAEPFRR
jgi:sterol desaturase/sphingolipid hydroxylase (fatty acid hydroxylase superfamily)